MNQTHELPEGQVEETPEQKADRLAVELIHWGETVTWNGYDWRPKPIDWND